jgi:nitrogen-specific signal transduction histidine kinase
MRKEVRKHKPVWLHSLPEITPEMVDFYVRRGKRLQSRAIREAIRRGWSALTAAPSARREAPGGRVAEPESQAADQRPWELAENARNALAAIRSSAELLREDGIAPAERSRFAEIVLAEERRLGALLGQLVDGGRRSAH